MASLVGSRVERKEDKRFLTGKGRYTADINISNQTYAYFVRSPHARAKINKIDTSKALKASGVVDILTGEHIAKDKIGGLIAGWAIRSEDGSEMKCPSNPPLAKDNANFVGDPIAVVFAESLEEAKAAAELVKIDYKVLKAVVNLSEAMNNDTIHEGIDKNLCYDWLLGDRQKVKEAFEKAVTTHVSKWHGVGQWNQFGARVMSGPRTGQYFIGTTNHYWKDYDNRVTTDDHNKDWARINKTYVEESSGMMFFVKNLDASYNDRRSTMWTLTYYSVSYTHLTLPTKA